MLTQDRRAAFKAELKASWSACRQKTLQQTAKIHLARLDQQETYDAQIQGH